MATLKKAMKKAVKKLKKRVGPRRPRSRIHPRKLRAASKRSAS